MSSPVPYEGWKDAGSYLVNAKEVKASGGLYKRPVLSDGKSHGYIYLKKEHRSKHNVDPNTGILGLGYVKALLAILSGVVAEVHVAQDATFGHVKTTTEPIDWEYKHGHDALFAGPFPHGATYKAGVVQALYLLASGEEEFTERWGLLANYAKCYLANGHMPYNSSDIRAICQLESFRNRLEAAADSLRRAYLQPGGANRSGPFVQYAPLELPVGSVPRVITLADLLGTAGAGSPALPGTWTANSPITTTGAMPPLSQLSSTVVPSPDPQDVLNEDLDLDDEDERVADQTVQDTPLAPLGPPSKTLLLSTDDAKDIKRAMVGRSGSVMLVGPTASGKALALTTPLATPEGWTTMGEVDIGDQLFDETGHPCTVTHISDIMDDHDVYDVCFSDGSVIRADGEHLWHTSTQLARGSQSAAKHRAYTSPADDHRRNQPRTGPCLVTTKQIKETLKGTGDRHNHSVDVAGPLDMPWAELPLDPYILGVWLGDGTSTCGVITTPDAEIVNALADAGFHPHKLSSPYGWGTYGMWTIIAGMGLKQNKHIPEEYLRASIDQRMALLQGLMDTDGCIGVNGACEFTACNERLAKGTCELLIGLGFKAAISEGRAMLYGKDCGPKYRISFTTMRQVFRMKRKRDRLPTSIKGNQLTRSIIDVRQVDSEPVKCVAVDSPSHLYLAGRSMIPTHNTSVAKYYGIDWVGPDGLLKVIKFTPGMKSDLVMGVTVPVSNPEGEQEYRWMDGPATQVFRYIHDTGKRGMLLCDEIARAHPSIPPLFMSWIETADRAEVLAARLSVKWEDPQDEYHVISLDETGETFVLPASLLKVVACANIGESYQQTVRLDDPALRRRFRGGWIEITGPDKKDAATILGTRLGLAASDPLVTALLEVEQDVREYNIKETYPLVMELNLDIMIIWGRNVHQLVALEAQKVKGAKVKAEAFPRMGGQPRKRFEARQEDGEDALLAFARAAFTEEARTFWVDMLAPMDGNSVNKTIREALLGICTARAPKGVRA